MGIKEFFNKTRGKKGKAPTIDLDKERRKKLEEQLEKAVPSRQLSPSEGKFPLDEDGEERPHEIEMIALKPAHVGREVKVQEPGKPSWHGLVDGWNPAGVLVQPKGGGARFVVKPEFLSWEV